MVGIVLFLVESVVTLILTVLTIASQVVEGGFGGTGSGGIPQVGPEWFQFLPISIGGNVFSALPGAGGIGSGDIGSLFLLPVPLAPGARRRRSSTSSRHRHRSRSRCAARRSLDPGSPATSRPLTFDVLLPAPADGSTRARLGHLRTPHGDVQTPVFMPVGTNATVKALDPDDLVEVGAQIILCNTYHLYLRPGPRAHRAARWVAPVHGLERADPDRLGRLPGRQPGRLPLGRRRRRHVPIAPRRLAPALHAGALDRGPGGAWVPTSPSASTSRCRRTRRSRREVAEATVRTDAGRSAASSAHARPDQALFGIIQGGLEPDLRAESTRAIAALPFDGICIGGLAGDETPRQRRAALDVVVPLLAGDPRPRYLMGLGSPMDLLDAVDAGIDMFDSVLPARVARNGSLWTPEGRLNLRNSRFLDDDQPIQDGCRCRACRTFSRAYLAHLLRADELLFYRLATCHNLTFILDFMAGIRAALAAGTFPELLRERRLALRDQLRRLTDIRRDKQAVAKSGSEAIEISGVGYTGRTPRRRDEMATKRSPPATKPRRSRRRKEAKPMLESLLQTRHRHSVELIKPKRKPRGSRSREPRGVGLDRSPVTARRSTRHDDHGDRPATAQRATAWIRRGEGEQRSDARAVDAAILAIEKQFGRGSIMKLGSSERQAGRRDPHRLHRA